MPFKLRYTASIYQHGLLLAPYAGCIPGGNLPVLGVVYIAETKDKDRYLEGLPLDEQELIAEAKSGRVSAYEELVRRNQELVFRAAYLVLQDSGDAEDAAQEAFVKAYRALSRFRPGSPFRPWLVRIVTNEARNARKAGQRRGALAQRYARGLEGDAASGSPESLALGDESRRRLLEALARLSDRDQAVLHQRYFLELTEAEMAEALGCRRGTVKSRLSRALQRLKVTICRHYPELVNTVEEVEGG